MCYILYDAELICIKKGVFYIRDIFQVLIWERIILHRKCKELKIKTAILILFLIFIRMAALRSFLIYDFPNSIWG